MGLTKMQGLKAVELKAGKLLWRSWCSQMREGDNRFLKKAVLHMAREDDVE